MSCSLMISYYFYEESSFLYLYMENAMFINNYEKEEVKLSPFSDDRVLYIEDSKEYTHTHTHTHTHTNIELTSGLSKVKG